MLYYLDKDLTLGLRTGTRAVMLGDQPQRVAGAFSRSLQPREPPGTNRQLCGPRASKTSHGLSPST